MFSIPGRARPIILLKRCIPPALTKEVSCLLEMTIGDEVTKTTKSPWATYTTPFKKDKGLRLSIDFRKLMDAPEYMIR
ncbi:hypothetical protein EGR_10452 [Echinococcus granulosus]|uniref:Uncharacterized protein n=1 Tax=Echinococcus granulosus TaxID=6210 RepID=W6U0P5_ECHGR|nr:hypothetical protein EGR_10452 [Echinococcus granulosus]EUB54690.1 hypothetical protein EGR_10452 [Echinococcus granulosus]